MALLVTRMLGPGSGASSGFELPTLSGLQFTVGAQTDVSAFGLVTATVNDPAISYLGGEPAMLGTAWPLDHFAGAFDLTFADGSRTGSGTRVAFDTDATGFDVLTLSQGLPSEFQVIVDGQLLQGATLALPPDGSLRFVHVDLSGVPLAPGLHQIELLYPGTGAFGGLVLPPGSALAPIADPGPRIVFLGDSFTEGTGAASIAQDYVELTGHYLGLTDIWQSGFGGTGYQLTLTQPWDQVVRPGLENRIAQDGVAAHGDIYVLAMGLNDSGTSPTLYASVVDTLTQLTSGEPNAQVFVVGPWNPSAQNDVTRSNSDLEIAAAATLFPQVHFLDPVGVVFTKADPTHPDQPGHETLARWLTVQIENAIGPAINHSADLIFQDPSSGNVAGWQIAADTVVGDSGYGTPGSGWTDLATGDFGGTGETDLLFRDTGGTFATWVTNGITLGGGGAIGNPGAAWTWIAAGDFNGDGKSDLLFHDALSGAYATWDISGTSVTGGGLIGTAAGYTFAGAGDLNGDGRTDLIFEDASGGYAAWFMNDTAIVGGGSIGNPGGSWQLKGTGDFNGDGKADLLFEDAGGNYAIWDMSGIQVIGGGAIGAPGGSWQLVRISDLNQDGKSDLVFEDAGGNYASWLMNGTAIVGGGSLGEVAAGWHLV